tara:strand:- start:3398 stop:4201 length:804 start_codon:yes stop_codon:yes gene_type:complete
MKNKVKKKQAHLKSKRQKALKRKRSAKSYRPKKHGLSQDPIIERLKELGMSQDLQGASQEVIIERLNQLVEADSVENLAQISFSYLEKGTNFYFQSENVEETAEAFVENKNLSISLSSGVRGKYGESGLEVSKPLTWVPQTEDPTVKDYLAELWNQHIEGDRQLNSFTFYLYDDEEGERDIEEDSEDNPFLSACVIVSGDSKKNIQGYLVMREVVCEDGQVKIKEPNIFLEAEDVLDLMIPPMVDMEKIFEEAKYYQTEIEEEEGGE